MSELPAPQERSDEIGRQDVERNLRQTIASGAFSHGWIIAGGDGAGKATLAYRIARAVLDPDALHDDSSLTIEENNRTFKLVAQGAHPDLFVAERLWIEKTSKFQNDITVETIRKLTQFLSHTPAFGGARVAIIDTADDLNRNAANALLKILEEPPQNTLLLLLSASPGRLLPTIRSRCRRLDLRGIEKKAIVDMLEVGGYAQGDDASRIADHADGRPGYALRLAAEGGAGQLALADAFLNAGRRDGDVSAIASKFTARTSPEEWAFFKSAVANALSDAARASGRGVELSGPLAGLTAPTLLSAYEQITSLAARGDALNLDRTQLVTAMGQDLGDILRTA